MPTGGGSGAASRVGPFEIDGVVGGGGMGVVYRAVGRDGEVVALKVLSPSKEDDPSAQHARRFAREAQIRIDHPNVVRVVDSGVDRAAPWIAFELLEGHSLRDRIRARGALAVGEALDLGMQACRGLSAAHRIGVVHRDVKPANVFLCRDGTVKLVDFGVARWSEVDPDLTADRRIIGTPSYLSPEQARGDGDVDHRADIWALGLILYESLTGFRPFSRKSTVATMLAVVLEEPPRLDQLRPGAPPMLVDVVHRCLDKSRDRRFESADSLLEALEAIEPVEAAEVVDAATLAGEDADETRLTMDMRSTTRIMAEGEVRVVAVVLADGVRDAAAIERAVTERDGVFIPLLARGQAIGLFGGEAWEGDEVVRAASAALVSREAAKWMAVASGRARAQGATIAGEAVEAAEMGCDVHLAGVALVGEAGPLLRDGFGVRDVREGLLELTEARRPFWPLSLQREAALPLVGREPEVERLGRAVERAIAGTPTGMLVVGPPGIGKTRLRQEVERLIEDVEPPVKMLTGRCEPLKRETAYALVRTLLEGRARLGAMLRGMPRIDEEAPVAERQEGVRALVRDAMGDGPRSPACATFLGELLGVPMPDDEALRAAREDPQLMADRFHMAVGDYLEAACEAGPVALLVDDLQWADEASLLVIEEMLALGDLPLLVVATARPEIDDRWPSRLAGPMFERVTLPGLDSRDVAELAHSIASRPVPDELVAALVERTGGNPLFIEQMVGELRDRELLDEPPEHLPMSLSVEAAVQSRLDHLPREEKELLKHAAVLGRSFAVDEVEALGVHEPQRLLASLVRRDFLSGRSRMRIRRGREYRFRSTLVADVAYRMLTDEVRRELHRSAARTFAEQTNADPEEIARHFEAGGETSQAAAYWGEAALGAARRGDSHAVLRCSGRALDLASGRLRPFPLYMARADALRFLGRRAEQQPELEAALAHAAGDREIAQVLIEQAVFASRTGDTPAALDAIARAVAHARSSGDAELLAMALGRQASVMVLAGKLAEAERPLAEAERLAADASPRVSAFVAEFRGLLGNAVGDLGMQVEAYREAVGRYEEVGDLRRAAGAENNVADAYNRVGAYREAEEALRDTVDKCRRVGNHLVEAYAMVNLGYARALQGLHAEALEAIDHARERARETRDVRLALFARVYRARTVLAMTSTSDAPALRALASEAEAAADEARDLSLPGIRALALSLAARALLAAGDPAGALERSAEAMRVRDALGSLEEDEGGVFLAHVRALEACGRPDEARATRQRARERLEELAGRIASDEWRDRFRCDVAAHRELLG